jgi:radical SAM-linked protein
MRLRITFAKTEAMRFTGHLDLHRTWERCFRRARLPLAYTQGFNPHPRLNLAAALPLGFTSQGEMIDAWLEQVARRDRAGSAASLAARTAPHPGASGR